MVESKFSRIIVQSLIRVQVGNGSRKWSFMNLLSWKNELKKCVSD